MARRSHRIRGPRFVFNRGDAGYPRCLEEVESPPKRLYGVGSPEVVSGGLAIVGARKATPYGIGCAARFGLRAARRGIAIVSGGARGCDAAAHRAALEAGAPTVVVMGGGIDQPYPLEHMGLFQAVVDEGGAVVSEQEWDFAPLPWCFRRRNRIIAGLSKATLIVEAGLPSGTFSTADAALAAGRDVMAVPGAITSSHSAGSNRLVAQGAIPIIDDESFDMALFSIFGLMAQREGKETPALSGLQRLGKLAAGSAAARQPVAARALLSALDSEALGMEELRDLAVQAGVEDAITWLMVWLAEAQRDGIIAKYPNGRYGPCVAR